eukprot:scaffold2175_cov381-Prasinococcus_capsulatus_cf.AAC.17
MATLACGQQQHSIISSTTINIMRTDVGARGGSSDDEARSTSPAIVARARGVQSGAEAVPPRA